MENKTLEQRIVDFWDGEIWKCNTKHIHNEKIKNVLYQIQKLVKSLGSDKTFYLLNDGDFEIKSTSKIESQIEKLKIDNIVYIKTHADCIPEYHNLIIESKKQLLFLPPTT